jgi:hypothetical protein
MIFVGSFPLGIPEEHILQPHHCGNLLTCKVCWLKREEIAGDWRKLHNEELLNLYFLSVFDWVTKSRKMRRTRGEEKGIHGFYGDTWKR